MPTLLQINVSVNSGSTGRIAEQLGEYALSKGWESYIAYGRKCYSSKSKEIKIGNSLDLGYHVFKTRLSDRHGLGSVRATRIFLREIRKLNPDIIHLHNIHGYYINYQVLFEYLAENRSTVVWTLHDCWPITGHCSYFSDINCLKWKVECHYCPKKRKYPASIIIDRSRLNYRLKKHHFTSPGNMTIIAVSKWLGDLVKESYLGEYPLQIINNGIDLNVFYPLSDCGRIRSKLGIFDKHMLLGVASTWDSRKGLDDYVRLSRFLSDEYVIVLIGLSKKQIKALPPNIIGLERTESIKELAELYSAADIVLNLSRLETFGMTTVEGFACGTPGIVYNCTASPELITNETGLIVESGNIGELVESIKIITTNSKKHYTANCRMRAEKFYSKEHQFDVYMRLYNDLLFQ